MFRRSTPRGRAAAARGWRRPRHRSAAGAAERGVERAFADGEAEQLRHQAAQPAIADRMGEAQIDRQRYDVEAERCARLQPFWQRRQRGPAAALAEPGISLHPRHHRPDLRQIDLVIASGQRVVGFWNAAWQWAQHSARAITVSSGFSASIRPPPFRPRLPWRGPAAWLVARLGFLPCEGGTDELSGVFGGSPAWPPAPPPAPSGLNLRPKRADQRVLLVMRQAAEVRKPGHPKLELRPSWSRQPPSSQPAQGGRQAGG